MESGIDVMRERRVSKVEMMTDIKGFILNELGYRSRREAFRKCSYGDKNEHKKFRVLCNKDKSASRQGLLSTVSFLLPNMIEARRYGYIPVVDLCRNARCQPLLQEPYLAKKENAWEYYFTQPNREISLDEVRESKCVEEQIKFCFNENYYMGDECFRSDIKIRLLGKAIRQNIHLQPKIRNRIVREKGMLFPQAGKILGVGIRAGYRAGIVRNMSLFDKHPIVGSCSDYIRNIEKRLSEWKYDSFFLAIDDRKYLEEIRRYFGEKCIYLERPRAHYFQDAMLDIPCIDRDEIRTEIDSASLRKRNEDYLVELYLLSQCDGLYVSRGTGHNFAYLLNHGRYAQAEFMDLGEFEYAK